MQRLICFYVNDVVHAIGMNHDDQSGMIIIKIKLI